MKFLPIAALLVSASAPALCAPVAATPATAGEMELHIEARGSIPADYAIVKRTASATSRGRPATEVALTAKIAEMKARLLKVGIPASVITVGEPTFSLDPDRNEFGGPREAMFAVALNKPVGLADPEAEEDADITAAEGAEDAALAASEAATAARNASKKVAKKRKLPYWSGTADVTVRLDDIKLYPAATVAIDGGYSITDDGAEFRFNTPDTVHARALADALAIARTEADLHAKALNAHIVRITRVSNRETPITMPEVAGFIVQMDQRKNAWRLRAAHSVSVAVDYVIAPN